LEQLFSLSNSTPKVAQFLTTIFGSIYHDRKHKYSDGKKAKEA
jgi:hypothetical protein